jgi:hypothetical protein
MAGYQELRPFTELQAQVPTGVVVPNLLLGNGLRDRMANHGSRLLLDDGSFLDGIRTLQPDEPIVIAFDAQPEDEVSATPSLSHVWPRDGRPPRTDIGIDPHYRAELKGGNEPMLDRALWLGVLVGRAMLTGQANTLRDQRYGWRRSDMAWVAGTGLAVAAASVALITECRGYPLAVGAGDAALCTASAGGLYGSGKRLARKNTEEYIASRLRKQAVHLARQHPSLHLDTA